MGLDPMDLVEIEAHSRTLLVEAASATDYYIPRLVAEIKRYRELCRRLTISAGPYAGRPLLIGGARPDYIGHQPPETPDGVDGHYCPWCGAIPRADDRHSADCPWPEVLREAGL